VADTITLLRWFQKVNEEGLKKVGCVVDDQMELVVHSFDSIHRHVVLVIQEVHALGMRYVRELICVLVDEVVPLIADVQMFARCRGTLDRVA